MVSMTHTMQMFDSDLRVWFGCFFLFLLCLGFSSCLILFKTVAIGISEVLPPKRWTEGFVTIGICVLFSFLGILISHEHDAEDRTFIFDKVTGTIIIPVVSLIHITAFGYVYGSDRFLDDVHCMVGDKLLFGRITFKLFRVWMKYSLKYAQPVAVAYVLIIGILDHKHAHTSDTVLALGYLVRTVIVLPILIVPIVNFMRDKGGTVKERLYHLVQPTSRWGPLRKIYRIETGYENDHDFSV